MSFLPLMKDESIVAQHYAARIGELTYVEYNRDKPKEVCIKQIQDGNTVYSVSYSPDGKYTVPGSEENVHLQDVVSSRIVFGLLEGTPFSVTCSNDG